MSTTEARPATVFVGCLPEVFGYGINVVAYTEEEAMANLREAFGWWVNGTSPGTVPAYCSDFDSAYEHFGGYVAEVTIGKRYSQGFQ